MRIRELTAFRVQLPLKLRVKHASHSRETSENVIVRCRLHDGTVGWGEGVPRPYVTGETPAGALQQLAATRLSEQLADDCQNWADVIPMCERLQLAGQRDDPRGCYGNAARCAVELSILDAYGRLLREPVSNVVAQGPLDQSLRAARTRVRYSGAITAGSRVREATGAVKMRLYGFAHCKLKVALAGVDDAPRLRRVRRWLGRRIDLRLDANEGWRANRLKAVVEPLLAYDISCIEQPVPHAEVEALRELRDELPVKIMLDESLTSMTDARDAVEQQLCDLFNLRLSKCGGFLNCLRLATVAHQAGLGYQLGCHPGESGILSAAGRHWAVSVAGIRYLEGSYDRHLMQETLTREDLTFGYGGWAPALTGPGLGTTVEQQAVEQLAGERQTYPIG